MDNTQAEQLSAVAPKTSFMTLPREIRDQIYGFLLPPSIPFASPEHGSRNVLSLKDGRLQQGVPGLSLLRVSSATNAEFTDCIFGCAFRVLIFCTDKFAFDMDKTLPPKPARLQMRFMLIYALIPDERALFLTLPELGALNDMIHLCTVHLGISILEQRTQHSLHVRPSIDQLQRNFILNGFVAQVLGSLPGPTGLGYVQHPPHEFPSHVRYPVPTEALTHMEDKYVNAVRRWLDEAHRSSF